MSQVRQQKSGRVRMSFEREVRDTTLRSEVIIPTSFDARISDTALAVAQVLSALAPCEALEVLEDAARLIDCPPVNPPPNPHPSNSKVLKR